MRNPLYNLCLILALLWCSSIQGVTIAWDSVSDAKGYKVYWGINKGVYDLSFDSGTNLLAIIPSPVGQQQHIVVTAYNSLGIESSYSEEIVYTRPQAVRVTLYLEAISDLAETNWVTLESCLTAIVNSTTSNLFIRGRVVYGP